MRIISIHDNIEHQANNPKLRYRNPPDKTTRGSQVLGGLDYTTFDGVVRNEYVSLAISAQKDDSTKNEFPLPGKFKPHYWV